MKQDATISMTGDTIGSTKGNASVRICIGMLCLLMLYAACRIIGKVLGYHAAAEEYASLDSAMTCITWEPVPEDTGDDFSSSQGDLTPVPGEKVRLPGDSDLSQSSVASGVIHDTNSSRLSAMNPDYCAWLSMDNLSISYPVVQDAGDEFYLTHSFLGTENPAGCLFIDPGASPDFSDLNTIIHGHNMRDGSMFGRLQLLAAESSRPEHPYFSLNVMGEERCCRIFAVVTVSSDSSLYRSPSEAAYDAYIEEIFGSTVLFADENCPEIRLHRPLVTLSTCCGAAGTDRRLLVFGVEM